ncbi:hypothetical protein O181_034377 [Austropuccinia psidii MF-1]|uniref:DDE Tnp4 domain-containing protein n=1 Tax=Austropuccinia psidii MF-1 TaxID=1389203 RepID=A0A9Q3D347_9BASI|nr:hypothetical protein [Austropuccinia psidii MF-1]
MVEYDYLIFQIRYGGLGDFQHHTGVPVKGSQVAIAAPAISGIPSQEKKKSREETLLTWMQILVTPDVPSIGMMISDNKPMLAMMVEWMISKEDSLNQFLRRVTSSRYLSLRDVLTTREDFSLACLLDMSERDFKESIRMSRHSFFQIYDMIKTSHLFQNSSHCPQLDLCHQSAMTLECLGSNGKGASIGRLARTYQISQGAVVNVSRRVIGELFALGYGEVFYDRKKKYSLNVQLVCDSRKRIIGLLSGWPESCGDSAVYKRMGLYLCPHDFFDRGQYLLSDLAYPLGPNSIPCYKGTAVEGHDNRLFNYCIADSRVQIEHCVGILKAPWASLRNLRLLCNRPEHMVDINRWIYVCAVLHNILIDKGDRWDLVDGPNIPNDEVRCDLRADSLEALDHCQDVQMACLRFHGDI